ncbi:hypothetical protein [Pseudonocardia nigra]|uniref:hypothetical protein n=1 Tax=Pseudonocardia nigra TaxID=1921578 RepID=UPI001C5D9C6C|nr:hypothetical protein [Pseudonocardia nigra]
MFNSAELLERQLHDAGQDPRVGADRGVARQQYRHLLAGCSGQRVEIGERLDQGAHRDRVDLVAVLVALLQRVEQFPPQRRFQCGEAELVCVADALLPLGPLLRRDPLGGGPAGLAAPPCPQVRAAELVLGSVPNVVPSVRVVAAAGHQAARDRRKRMGLLGAPRLDGQSAAAVAVTTPFAAV